jgi:hypothetical protein
LLERQVLSLQGRTRRPVLRAMLRAPALPTHAFRTPSGQTSRQRIALHPEDCVETPSETHLYPPSLASNHPLEAYADTIGLKSLWFDSSQATHIKTGPPRERMGRVWRRSNCIHDDGIISYQNPGP